MMARVKASNLLIMTCCVLCALAVMQSSRAQTPVGASPLDAPPFSASPSELLKAAAAVPVPEGKSVVVLREENTFSFEEDGRDHWSSHLIYKIVTEAGVAGWDSIAYAWSPWYQRRPTIRARVVTADGAEHDLDLSTLVESQQGKGEGKVYSDRKRIQGPLPAVAPGAVVEWSIDRVDEAPYFKEGVVREVYFGNTVPTEMEKLTVDFPEGMPMRYEIGSLEGMVPNRSEEGGRVKLEFVRGRMNALEDFEELTPSDVRQWPVVAFSNGKSWQDVARGYDSIFEPLVAPDAVRGLVSKLTARKTGRLERAEALMEWIHHEVRYTGVEFGAAGLVPAPVSEILKRKYGDCKEQSLLLVSMLRAAGIEAHVALLWADSGPDGFPELPGLGDFNHAIVYAPPEGGEGALWMDPSLEYARPGELSADSSDRLALVIAPDAKGLVRTPAPTPEDNLYTETREYRLAEDGPGQVTEITALRGGGERGYRNYYAQTTTKDVREQLKKYVKEVYLSDKLGTFRFTPPQDLSEHFQLTLEVPETDRASTGEKAATIYLPYGALFKSLPGFLKEKEKEKKDAANAEGEKEETEKPRKYDAVLQVPFAAEIRSKIVPPPGFRPSALPESTEEKLGPAVFSKHYELQADGSLLVTIRFDTVVRRLTPPQQADLRDGVVRLMKADAPKVTFEQIGEAYLSAGKYREALEEFSRLEKLHPKEALHKIQTSQALLSAGLGEPARAEASAATALEPKNWKTWQNLGWTLQHDLLGRRLFPGFDYQGAAAAYKKAQELAPDEMEVTADLAILYEHDERGLRYVPGAHLDEAIAEYEKIVDKTRDTNLANNLPYAFLYARRFDDLKKFLAAEKPNLTFQCLQVTATAATDGVEPAKALADKIIAQEKDRRSVLTTAGSIMTKLRMYPEAAALLTAGAQGQEDAADQLGRAEVLRRTKRLELQAKAPASPADAVLCFLWRVLRGDTGSYEDVISRQGVENMDKEEAEKNARRIRASTISTARSSSIDPRVLFDVGLSILEPVAEGSDQVGYRVRLPQPYSNEVPSVFYVVKEEGRYKVLGTDEEGDVGRLVLKLLEEGRIEDARQWLDWARDEYSLGGGDDPLSGAVFSRIWTKGTPGDAETARVAAACLITLGYSHEEQAVPILESALAKAQNEDQRTNLHLALAWALRDLKRFPEQLDHAQILLKAYPRSFAAYKLCEWALAGEKRWDDLHQLTADRLSAMPDDVDTLRFKASMGMLEGGFDTVKAATQRILDLGRPTAEDYNRLAWIELFRNPPLDPQAQDLARRAVAADTSGSWGIIHTLAAVYADSGRPAEAYDLLIKAMKANTQEEPTAAIWCVMGRIAEEYGQKDAALADFRKAIDSKAVPFSSEALAKLWLDRVQVEGKKKR